MPEKDALTQLRRVLGSYGLEFTVEMLAELCRDKAASLREGIPQHIGTPEQWDAAAEFLELVSITHTIRAAR